MVYLDLIRNELNLNDEFTFDYFQPSEYHFSLDSVLLPKIVAKQLKKDQIDVSSFKVLDLCSGTGIIGLEFSHYLPQINAIDFLEVQKVYEEYFKKNLALVAPSKMDFNFLNLNYDELISNSSFHEKYDLILCNPPYFFKNEGVLSPSEFKNRCRFFMDSSFDNLIKAVGHALKFGANAYILARPGHDHNRGPETSVKNILTRCFVDKFSVESSFTLRNVISIKITKLFKE